MPINTATFEWTKSERDEAKFDPMDWSTEDNFEKLENCALCTAGALTHQTSGDVNAELQKRLKAQRWGPYESDQAFIIYASNDPQVSKLRVHVPEYQNLADQIVGIAAYVQAKLKSKVAYSMQPADFVARNPDGRARGDTAIAFMKRQPDGTEFAVLTTDVIFGGNAHWIFAQKRDGAVAFTDFQWDRQFPLSKEFEAALRTRFKIPSGVKFPTGAVCSQYPLGPRGEYKNPQSMYMFAAAFGATVVP